MAAIALAAGGYAIQQHENGNIQHRNSLSEQVASEAEGLDASQPNLAKQLRIAGYDVAHTPQAYSSLFSASGLAGTISLAGVTDAAFSPDGRLLALVAGQQVRLWDRAAQRMAAAAPASRGATGAAFDTIGHLLAVAAGNGTTELWDVSSPGHPISVASLTGPAGPVEQVAFSGRGHLLAAADWDHHVWVWDVSRPARPDRLAMLPADGNVASSVTFTADGRLLAAETGTAPCISGTSLVRGHPLCWARSTTARKSGRSRSIRPSTCWPLVVTPPRRPACTYGA